MKYFFLEFVSKFVSKYIILQNILFMKYTQIIRILKKNNLVKYNLIIKEYQLERYQIQFVFEKTAFFMILYI